jgi:hypothetical protein
MNFLFRSQIRNTYVEFCTTVTRKWTEIQQQRRTQQTQQTTNNNDNNTRTFPYSYTIDKSSTPSSNTSPHRYYHPFFTALASLHRRGKLPPPTKTQHPSRTFPTIPTYNISNPLLIPHQILHVNITSPLRSSATSPNTTQTPTSKKKKHQHHKKQPLTFDHGQQQSKAKDQRRRPSGPQEDPLLPRTTRPY